MCSCSCERCLDGKIIKSAFASMELLLSRIDNTYPLHKYIIEIVNMVSVWSNNNRIEVTFYDAFGSGIHLYLLTSD